MPENWTAPSSREVLEQVRNIVRDHPERHNQRHWVSNELGRLVEVYTDKAKAYAMTAIPEQPENPRQPYCGTTGCVAGWSSILAAPPGSYLHDDYYVRTPDGTSMTIFNYAQKALGLSYGQATWLFDGIRTREEVLDGLNALLEDPEEDLAELHSVTYTVKVLDSEGNELHSREVSANRDADEYDILQAARNRA